MKIKGIAVVLCLAMVLTLGTLALAENGQNEPVENTIENRNEYQYERQLGDCDEDCDPVRERMQERRSENRALMQGDNGRMMQRRLMRAGQ